MVYKIYFFVLLFSTSFFFHKSLFAKVFYLPKPNVDTEKNIEISPNSSLDLSGNGFIKNFPEIHKIFLTKSGSPKKRYRLKVLEAQENKLKLLIPENMAFGDYDLRLRLKSRKLKSPIFKALNLFKLKPKAPLKPNLSEIFLNKSDDLNLIFDLNNPDNILVFPEILEIGKNEIRAFYIDSFSKHESLLSQPAELYYLPENSLEPSLEVVSTSPLETYAKVKNSDLKIDLSDFTEIEFLELKSSYFIITPWNPRFLEYSEELSPIFISEIKVTEEERAIIKNRSSSLFSLEGCYLSDSLKIRYEFKESDFINPNSEILIQANLGLNDSTPDLLSISCLNEKTDDFQILDIFNYEKFDENGLGIKSKLFF